MHAPPSGSQSQDTQVYTELLSQDLLDGSKVLTYGPGFSSKIQSRLQTLLPVVHGYTSFYASPSHCWLCFLVPNEYFSVFKSGCGLLCTALTQRAERRNTERSFPFLQHHSPGKTTRRKSLACSITAAVLDRSCLAALQGHSYSMH